MDRHLFLRLGAQQPWDHVETAGDGPRADGERDRSDIEGLKSYVLIFSYLPNLCHIVFGIVISAVVSLPNSLCGDVYVCKVYYRTRIWLTMSQFYVAEYYCRATSWRSLHYWI